MCPQYTDAPSPLSFSMFSGPWNWGTSSNLELKLERSYHREYVYKVSSWLDFNFIKNYLDQNLKRDRRTNGRTNERTDERTNGRTNERTDERTNKRKDGRTKERTDERTHRPENIMPINWAYKCKMYFILSVLKSSWAFLTLIIRDVCWIWRWLQITVL